MGIKIVVAGGLGFMGSDFVRYLCDLPDVDSITVIDNFSYSADERRLDGYKDRVLIVDCDIRDRMKVLQITEDADYVVNFAAETHNDNSLLRPMDFVSSNIDGVLSLLEAARVNGFRLHQVSTDEVFGDMEVGSLKKFTENSPTAPSSPYSASKAAGDSLCMGWHRSFGVNVTISNSANNFGPGQNPEKLIPNAIALIHAGHRPRLYGDGSNVRDWIFVRDHSRAVWEILTKAKSGERFVVSAEDLISNLNLVQILLEAAQRPLDYLEFVSDRPGHDRQYASSARKLRRELAWHPSHTGIRHWLSREALSLYRN